VVRASRVSWEDMVGEWEEDGKEMEEGSQGKSCVEDMRGVRWRKWRERWNID
jgi:hypothetical protein